MGAGLAPRPFVFQMFHNKQGTAMRLTRPYLEELATRLRVRARIIAACRGVLPYELEMLEEYLELVKQNCPHATVAIAYLQLALHEARDVVHRTTNYPESASLAAATAIAVAAGALQQALERSTCPTTQQVLQ
jgi:hypothetical protein